MTYDFFVLPAGDAEDLEQAVAVYESAPPTGPLTPGGPVARFVAGLAALARDGVPAEEADGTDAGCYVRTSWDDPMANLGRVAGLAREHGLAVLDVQLAAFYHPRNAVDVALRTEAGPRLPYLTRRILREVTAHIRDGRYRWLTEARADGTFAQGFRDDDGSWAVEHRERGRHFAARTRDEPLVEDLLWSWARGDDRWRAMIAFSPIVL